MIRKSIFHGLNRGEIDKTLNRWFDVYEENMLLIVCVLSATLVSVHTIVWWVQK